MKHWFISQSVDHPIRTIILTLFITVIMGLGMRYFVIEDDFMKILPQDIQSMITLNRIQDQFGSTDLMFIAFGHRDKDALNTQTLADLWDVTAAMDTMSQVDEIISIATADRMDAEDGFLDINPMQPQRELAPEEIDDLRQYLQDTPKMKMRVLSSRGDYLNIVIKTIRSPRNDVLVHDLKIIVADHLSDYDVHWGGQSYLTGALPVLIRNDVGSLMKAGLIGMLLILLLSFRNIPSVGMVLATIILSMIFMLGFNGWMYFLTGSDAFLFGVTNTSMPIILLTIANSYGVHIITKFFRKMRDRKDARAAVEASLNSLLLPIFLAALTTIAAFLCMIFAPLDVLIGYGFSISAGIIWAWILTSTFLPAILYLKRWKATGSAVSHAGSFERMVVSFGAVIIKHPRSVLTTAIGVVIVGAFGIFQLNIEVNMKEFFKKDNPIRQSLQFMDDEMTGLMDLELLINADLKSPEVLNKIASIQSFMDAHPSVTLSISIADIIKQMHRMINDNDPAFETIPDTREKVNNLFTMYSMSGDPDDFNALVDYDYKQGLATSMMRSISTSEIIQLVDEIEAFLEQKDYQDLDITISGLVVVFRDLVALIIRSSFISILASILLIFIITAYFFKNWRWGLLSIIPLSSAVILNFGLMGLVGIDLNHVTALLSAIIIGVGVDFAIHYISQFRIHLQRDGATDQISLKTMEDVGFPIILDAASNMAFGALLFSEFVPMIHMGGLMVLAMISTSLGTLTLLAIILEMLKEPLSRIERLVVNA